MAYEQKERKYKKDSTLSKKEREEMDRYRSVGEGMSKTKNAAKEIFSSQISP
jgi:hypothetical protein